MSLVGLFCDIPHLTTSDNKLFVEIRQTSTAASKKAVNGTCAKYYPSTAFFAERCICSLLSINYFAKQRLQNKKYAATRGIAAYFVCDVNLSCYEAQ